MAHALVTSWLSLLLEDLRGAALEHGPEIAIGTECSISYGCWQFGSVGPLPRNYTSSSLDLGPVEGAKILNPCVTQDQVPDRPTPSLQSSPPPISSDEGLPMGATHNRSWGVVTRSWAFSVVAKQLWNSLPGYLRTAYTHDEFLSKDWKPFVLGGFGEVKKSGRVF